MIYFDDGTQELVYNDESGDFITQWWDANCSYLLNENYWYLYANCANSSLIFYPDSNMYSE